MKHSASWKRVRVVARRALGGSGFSEAWRRIAGEVRRSSFLDRDTRRFITHNRAVWGSWKTQGAKSVILVDFYPVSETNIARSYFLNVLARKRGSAIRSFGPPTWRPRRWLKKVFESFNVSAHVVTTPSRQQRRMQRTLTDRIVSSLGSKEELLELEVLGIPVGIDIYESYLLGFREPTVRLGDPRLREMIAKGVGLVLFWQEYFRTHEVAAVVVSHDCYLDYNVPCKLAYSAGIPVYLPNPVYMTYAVRPHSSQAHFPRYREIFRQLPAQQQREGLEWARRQLTRRLSGEVGVDMPYALRSAFSSNGEAGQVLKKSDRTKVLICTHCFYDDPHAYGGLLFPDFFEWIRFLGGIAARTDYDWYLKVHPDPLPGTLEIVEELLAECPRIKLIPHHTSHHQIASEGLNVALTAYGSIGHEYPLLDVQVVNAGYNPRVAYDFNRHPKSRAEYKEILLNLHCLEPPSWKPEDLYEFYYMHHEYTYVDNFYFPSYRQYLSDLSTEERVGSRAFSYFLDRLPPGKHEQIIGEIERFIDSGKSHYWSRGPE